MPDGIVEWSMFLFFAVGSLGGWVLLATFLYEAWKLRDR